MLRNFLREDVDAVQKYASDEEVVRFLPWGPNNESETREFIAEAMESRWEMPRTWYELAITLVASDELIGGCGLYINSFLHQEGEIGYCLNRRFWGQGYATEACFALLSLAFAQLSLHRVQAFCDCANRPSIHVLEKIGMHQEGRLRQNKYCQGQWRDSFLYAIVREEWNSG